MFNFTESQLTPSVSPAGLVVQHVEGPHVFSKGQLQEAAQLLFRMGLLLWQQALLCPNSIGKLASRRLDVGPEGDDAAGAQVIAVHTDGVPCLLHEKFMKECSRRLPMSTCSHRILTWPALLM